MTDILHYYLDLLRNENEDRFGFHNVLNVMKQSRGGYVLNESFDGIDLRNEPLVGIHFSDEDGQNASSFRGCKVSRNCFLSGHSAPIESMEFIDDNTLVSRSANEVITWDIWSGGAIEIKQSVSENGNNTEVYDNYLTSEEIHNVKKRIVEITKKDETDFICLSSDCRLVSLIIENKHLVIDLDTRNIFHYWVSKIIKIDNEYIFYDYNKKEICIYNPTNGYPKPFDKNNFFNKDAWDVSLFEIKNSDYILANINDSEPSNILSFIIDVKRHKIVLHFNEWLISPVYLPEMNCIFIKHQDNFAKLYMINSDNCNSISNNKVIAEFKEINYSFIQSTIAISKRKQYIAVSNHFIDIYCIETGKHIKTFGGKSIPFTAVVSPNQQHLFCFSANYCMIFNLQKRHIINNKSKISIQNIIDVTFSANSNIFIFHNRSEDSINFFDKITGHLKYTIYSPYRDSDAYQYFKYYFTFTDLWWDYSGKYIFLRLNLKNGSYFIYDENAVCVHSSILLSKIDINSYIISMSISDNTKYLAYFQESMDHFCLSVKNLETNNEEMCGCKCKYILNVSNDGRYVTVVNDVDFDKAIIKTQVLDMHEKTIFSEKTIEKDYILLNYLRQYIPKQRQEYTSSGWTIKVPSSPDNSTEALIYLVPNLYIGGCDFRGSTFDDETKEIIRQYNGIV